MRLLGLREPSYLHLPVLVDASGAKLSKSEDAAAVDADDPLPALRAALAILGLPENALRAASPRMLLHDALAAFDAGAIPKAGEVSLQQERACIQSSCRSARCAERQCE